MVFVNYRLLTSISFYRAAHGKMARESQAFHMARWKMFLQLAGWGRFEPRSCEGDK